MIIFYLIGCLIMFFIMISEIVDKGYLTLFDLLEAIFFISVSWFSIGYFCLNWLIHKSDKELWRRK